MDLEAEDTNRRVGFGLLSERPAKVSEVICVASRGGCRFVREAIFPAQPNGSLDGLQVVNQLRFPDPVPLCRPSLNLLRESRGLAPSFHVDIMLRIMVPKLDLGEKQ